MQGNNIFHLNEATMIEAMQQYLDQEMKNAPKVTGVKVASPGSCVTTFEILLTGWSYDE